MTYGPDSATAPPTPTIPQSDILRRLAALETDTYGRPEAALAGAVRQGAASFQPYASSDQIGSPDPGAPPL